MDDGSAGDTSSPPALAGADLADGLFDYTVEKQEGIG